jgi:hypothetical protein
MFRFYEFKDKYFFEAGLDWIFALESLFGKVLSEISIYCQFNIVIKK